MTTTGRGTASRFCSCFIFLSMLMNASNPALAAAFRSSPLARVAQPISFVVLIS